MKKFISALAVLMMISSQAFASGVGYIDYQKVIELTPFAKNTMKVLDTKALELQQYLVDKEKEYKLIDAPAQKKNFQDKVANDFKAKEAAYMKLKIKFFLVLTLLESLELMKMN